MRRQRKGKYPTEEESNKLKELKQQHDNEEKASELARLKRFDRVCCRLFN